MRMVNILLNFFYSDYVGVKVEVMVRLTRSGLTESTIQSRMKSDVEDNLIQNLIDNSVQTGYHFNPGLTFHDPRPGITINRRCIHVVVLCLSVNNSNIICLRIETLSCDKASGRS